VMFAAAPQAFAATKTVRYGPYTIPAGTMENPGMLTKFQFRVQRPCSDCFIIGFKPDLVFSDGTRATMENGAMLHHAVWTSQWRSDATCGSTALGLAGERFFATGNERTAISFPSGYGYRVRWYDSWNMLADLMNHSAANKTVYVQVTYTYRPSWENVKRLRPVWLDIDQCGDSEYYIPAGSSVATWDWKVNVPGRIVAAIGHVHGHGVAVEAKNMSRNGESICRSESTLDPLDVHVVLAMETCPPEGNLPYRVERDQIVRLYSEYVSKHEALDVMGIMLMWVHPT